ncbi:hypothetical protein ColTof4_05980 [Colletotrichum tofieldiae]|uniref:Integral membrane protein n=1 Tax=Colletotrichum tofieldiae TaxID=708197 RepID=A0A166SG33_9PEZI|nr:hypothetical protein CT0861_05925 [Colletotrichum tofieldiae]GKT53818.1 hypothetical protein ColTof3_01157 [Colletotrichum tofieldiae]GKT73557.1 hypothetical protein ColTof4_05980 [Colletotrichum tofieldiae]GKT95501.1 hypothetical protein Ct61P_13351 [Colletotrichum tofieldiae]
MAESGQTPGICVIEANPDATGTGIRASIYALCLASGILKTIIQLTTSEKNYTEFCQAINSALQLQGLALLCTAVYQTFKGQLTLFHAICVLHLLSLLGFGLVAQRRYQGGGLNRWLVMAALRVIIACAFTALTAYIWVTAPTFGSQPDCNASTFYVVFGVSLHATNDVFRYVILALMASMAVGWVFSMVIYVFLAHCCCGGVRSGMKWARRVNPDVEALKNVVGRIKVSDPKYKRDIISGQVVQLFIQTGINVYMIVTLEQIVKRNHLSEEEKEWTFGQVLAIFVLLGVVVEVINILLPKLDRDVEEVPAQDEIELRPQWNAGGRLL